MDIKNKKLNKLFFHCEDMIMKNIIRKYRTETIGSIQNYKTSSDGILIVICGLCGYFSLPSYKFALYISFGLPYQNFYNC